MGAHTKGAEQGAPKVFISSTAEDLAECRAAAKEAALHADFLPVMHEYWPAKDKPPYAECMARVDGCQVLVVIAAHRYGWEPPDQPAADDSPPKSITWLECERAIGNDAKVLAFLVDDSASWPLELREDYAVTRALQEHGVGTEFNHIAQETVRKTQRLATFKDWLRERGIRAAFTDAPDVGQAVERALRDWKAEHFPRPERTAADGRGPTLIEIPAGYLAWLTGTCESVELLGLDVQEAYAPRLSQVYVPAVTSALAGESLAGDEEQSDHALARDAAGDRGEASRDALLLDRLDQESLYVPGPAGAGKSTFCRWAAWLAAAGEMPAHRVAPPDAYREPFPASFAGRLPVLVVLRDFWPALSEHVGVRAWTRAALEQTLADWVDRRHPGGLSGARLRAFVEQGAVLLLLDGVDEVPVSDITAHGTAYPRALLLSGLSDALPAWTEAGNRVLLTSRPYGLNAAEVKRLALATASLEALPEALQDLFVARWFAAADPERADEKTAGLIEHIRQRPELRELTGNPMLLGALCVRYNQGSRLPEDRYWLYHSVVNSVLYNRYLDEARERDPVRRRLAAVALGMHTGSAVAEARVTPVAEVPESEVDRILQDFAAANRATEGVLNDAARKRANLLSRSGLLLPRARQQAAFYHFSFQEFLAAEHVVQTERDEAALMRQFRERATVPEWRPTLVFLFSALAFQHGSAQWAMDRLTEFASALSREVVKQNPAPAVFVADCLDIALSKRWHLGSLEGDFRALCLNAIADEVELPVRARLAETLAELGDTRPGVGLRDAGLPDIDWVAIPGGEIGLEGVDGRFQVAPCAIARHPITWAQYRAFLEDPAGYANETWWQDLKHEAEPGEQLHSVLTCPAERVSWYDAMAFCRWLTARYRAVGLLKPDGVIRLPTEWEWQQAATGGSPANVYAWGEHWEEGRANTWESALGASTPVGILPSGASAQGVLDLAGNVWEWCLNKYEDTAALQADTSGDVRVFCAAGPGAAVRTSPAARSATGATRTYVTTAWVFGC